MLKFHFDLCTDIYIYIYVCNVAQNVIYGLLNICMY